jgi:hypothetical protein
MKTKHWIVLILLVALVFAGCSPSPRVGELKTEAHSVPLDNAKSVRVEVSAGAAALTISGGADNLLDSDFTYNVAEMKPQVEYKNGVLIVKHADVNGPSSLQGITGYRNEWNLHLSNKVPMDLSVDLGAGVSNLQLAGLPLTNLNVTLGAGESTIDLSGDWTHDLLATIETGAAAVTVLLPKDVGVYIQMDSGASVVNAPGLKKDGDVYTNDAYGVSGVTIQITMEAGIGAINLEVVGE